MSRWDIDYGIKVLKGEIITGRLLYLAVVRHYRDLLDGAKRGLYFSPWHVNHFLEFCENYFQHIEGPLAGKKLVLEPWQVFWSAVEFGWRKESNQLRRFTRSYGEVARKAGKSTWTAAKALYLFLMDKEVGAKVYTGATTRAQAMTVFNPAFANVKRWARESPAMASSIKIHEGLNQERLTMGASVLAPLASNADAMDGLNPHAFFYDELHAAKNDKLWNVVETAMGARAQPFLGAITTGGFILDGICADLRKYAEEILEGRIVDDSFVAYIYCMDAGDDPFDEYNWYKSNPGLGVNKSLQYMRDMAKKAKFLPGILRNWLVKDLNEWLASALGWLDLAVWDGQRATINESDLIGRRCIAGLDLSAVRDLTCAAYLFAPAEGSDVWDLLTFFWCPEAGIEQRGDDDKAPYEKWAKEKWLIPTPGDVVDYSAVIEHAKAMHAKFNIVDFGYDDWSAHHVVPALVAAGLPMVEVRQNMAEMHPGSRQLERLLFGKKIRHNGNPVMRWCVSNATLIYDTNGNFRPDKRPGNLRGRIDGVAATVIGLSRAVTPEEKEESKAGFVELD